MSRQSSHRSRPAWWPGRGIPTGTSRADRRILGSALGLDFYLGLLGVLLVLGVPVGFGAGCVVAGSDRIEPVRVAVATNFRTVFEELAAGFETASGVEVSISAASTGKLYAQIVQGAPFDVFLAANAEAPARLEAAGLARAGSRTTYALGRLALWSREAGRVDGGGRVLEDGSFERLALANPRLAPYGRAAMEVLTARGLWPVLADRTVIGESVGQAFHFVASGNAELGFVARSQLAAPEGGPQGSLWAVPSELHRPIEQQLVVLSSRPEAGLLASYLLAPAAREILVARGYEVP